MTLLGHDFGRTPFGVEAVAAAARRDVVEPAPVICICDPWFRDREVFDARCPTHGLEATLRAAVARLREDDSC